MNDTTENAFKNRCVICGDLIPGATSGSLATCGICGRTACQMCSGKMHMHHMRVEGTIMVCPECSSKLQDKGNKPINPYGYLGGF